MVAGGLFFVPFVAFNFLFSTEIFEVVFGARWVQAGQFAAYAGIASGFMTLTVWLDRVYDIRGRQRLALALEAINDIACLGTLALIMHFTRDVVAGIAGFSFATVGFYVLWTYEVFRIAPFPMKYFRNFIGAIVVSTALVFLIASLARNITHDWLEQAIIFVVLSAPLVAGGALVGRNSLNQRATGFAAISI